MRILLVVVVFVLGIALGYIFGVMQSDSTNNNQNILTTSVSEDSDENNSNIHHSSHSHEESEMIEEDTLSLSNTDSTNIDVSISTEKLVHSVQYPIIFLAEEIAEGDSSMAEMLGIDEVQSKSMFVEFWESPLNFEGYKLSKKKLVVYGLSPQFDYKVYKEGESYFLSYQNVYYKMKETQDFLPFTQVPKQEVFND